MLRAKAPAEQRAILSSLSHEELTTLYDTDLGEWRWGVTRRADQGAPEGAWTHWLVMAGRGWGKTRTGAEFIVGEVMAGRMSRVALVGRTAADVRDVMIEGPSGLLACARRYRLAVLYEPSKRRVTFGTGAAVAIAYTAEQPEMLRGPEHDGYWCDELGAWRTKKPGAGSDARNLAEDAWDNLMFGFRRGTHPRGIITTTPRPVPLVRRILADPKTTLTRGKTLDNRDNLASNFVNEITTRYLGTRLGRQELDGELLDDIEGALWNIGMIDAGRVDAVPVDERGRPRLARVVVAVDPAATSSSTSDFTGIVVAGLGHDGDLYVLHAEHVHMSPHGWSSRVVELFRHHAADRIIAERNNGGEMVEHTIRSNWRAAPVRTIVASRGKTLRAEPIAALYEQGRVHHVWEPGPRARENPLLDLEDEMTAFPVAAEHDDLVDALVYALTELSPMSGGELHVL